MSDETRKSQDTSAPRPRTVHKQHSVVLYIVILFLAACLLILLSASCRATLISLNNFYA